MKANRGMQLQTKANKGKQRQTKANEGNILASQPLLPRNAALHRNSEPVRHVFIKAANGRTMTVHVHSWHDPVSTIETHMGYKQGAPVGQHRLVFAGKALTHGHWTLA